MSALTRQYHCELINGHEVEKPVPKRLHGLVQTLVAAWLLRQLPPKFDVMTELNVWCGNERLVPDIVVALRSALYRNEDLIDKPALAVEISSPGQTMDYIVGKCTQLLRAGADTCWVIDPLKRRAWNYRIDELSEVDSSAGSLVFGESSEGPFGITERLPAAELWGELDRRGL